MAEPEMICHQPYKFVNGRQRCSRCGEVLEVDSKTAIDAGVSWVCRNADGSQGESILPPVRFRPGQHKCGERPWVDEMGHVAGAASGSTQPCRRCGEDLGWLFWSEPLVHGTEVTIRIEGQPGEYVKHSGRNAVESRTVLCVAKN